MGKMGLNSEVTGGFFRMSETVILVMVAVLCGAVLGFWLGRYSQGRIWTEEEREEESVSYRTDSVREWDGRNVWSNEDEGVWRSESETDSRNAEGMSGARNAQEKRGRVEHGERTYSKQRQRTEYNERGQRAEYSERGQRTEYNKRGQGIEYSGGLDAVERRTSAASFRRSRFEKCETCIGSPVSGQIVACREGCRPGVVIRPDGDKIYAPAGGKIIRLFPMGNAFLFATDAGAILNIHVGEAVDELMVGCFRPKIIQNEVVNKGKLLLEFDREGLEAEGIATEVSLSVEELRYGESLQIVKEGRVKPGEDIFEIEGV